MQVTEMRVLETNRRERDGVGISRSNGQTGNQQIMPTLDYLEVFKNCWLIVLGGTPMQACPKDVTFRGGPNWVDRAVEPCVAHPCSHPYLSIANELMLF